MSTVPLCPSCRVTSDWRGSNSSFMPFCGHELVTKSSIARIANSQNFCMFHWQNWRHELGTGPLRDHPNTKTMYWDIYANVHEFCLNHLRESVGNMMEYIVYKLLGRSTKSRNLRFSYPKSPGLGDHHNIWFGTLAMLHIASGRVARRCGGTLHHWQQRHRKLEDCDLSDRPNGISGQKKISRDKCLERFFVSQISPIFNI